MNTKRFHQSDSLIYEAYYVEYPYDDKPTFRRKTFMVHASPNVTWQDIVLEMHKKARLPTYLKSGILTTCMVDHPELVVGMTFQGAIREINTLPTSYIREDFAFNDKVERFAQEMINRRDSCEKEGLGLIRSSN